mgnify:CR=1 FL=1
MFENFNLLNIIFYIIVYFNYNKFIDKSIYELDYKFTKNINEEYETEDYELYIHNEIFEEFKEYLEDDGILSLKKVNGNIIEFEIIDRYSDMEDIIIEQQTNI